MKNYIIILIAIVAGCSSPAKIQRSAEQRAALQDAIKQRTYIFQAQTAQPASGRSKQLTSAYYFIVNKDSVISELPYFGRAYAAPLDVTQSVLQFNSQKFDYRQTGRNDGGWNIDIKFNDVREVQSVSLVVSGDGYGSLQVIPTNRQTISFNGNVVKK